VSGTESAIDKAEAVVIDLEGKAEAIKARLAQISTERQRLGFDAFAHNDADSKKLLKALNAEALNFDGEIEAISAALVEARAAGAGQTRRGRQGGQAAGARSAQAAGRTAEDRRAGRSGSCHSGRGERPHARDLLRVELFELWQSEPSSGRGAWLFGRVFEPHADHLGMALRSGAAIVAHHLWQSDGGMGDGDRPQGGTTAPDVWPTAGFYPFQQDSNKAGSASRSRSKPPRERRITPMSIRYARKHNEDWRQWYERQRKRDHMQPVRKDDDDFDENDLQDIDDAIDTTNDDPNNARSTAARHCSDLADLIVEAQPGLDRSDAIRWLLNNRRGHALLLRTLKRRLQKGTKQMTSYNRAEEWTAIVKQHGPISCLAGHYAARLTPAGPEHMAFVCRSRSKLGSHSRNTNLEGGSGVTRL
jgi:hypothetical protein